MTKNSIHKLLCVSGGTIVIVADFSIEDDGSGFLGGTPNTDLVVGVCWGPASIRNSTNNCLRVSNIHDFINSIRLSGIKKIVFQFCMAINLHPLWMQYHFV